MTTTSLLLATSLFAASTMLSPSCEPKASQADDDDDDEDDEDGDDGEGSGGDLPGETADGGTADGGTADGGTGGGTLDPSWGVARWHFVRTNHAGPAVYELEVDPDGLATMTLEACGLNEPRVWTGSWQATADGILISPGDSGWIDSPYTTGVTMSPTDNCLVAKYQSFTSESVVTDLLVEVGDLCFDLADCPLIEPEPCDPGEQQCPGSG